MKRNISKTSYRGKTDKTEKKANIPDTSRKEKISKRKRSLYDDFDEEDLGSLDPKLIKLLRSGK